MRGWKSGPDSAINVCSQNWLQLPFRRTFFMCPPPLYLPPFLLLPWLKRFNSFSQFFTAFISRWPGPAALSFFLPLPILSVVLFLFSCSRLPFLCAFLLSFLCFLLCNVPKCSNIFYLCRAGTTTAKKGHWVAPDFVDIFFIKLFRFFSSAWTFFWSFSLAVYRLATYGLSLAHQLTREMCRSFGNREGFGEVWKWAEYKKEN